jgi:hypothetical protein
MLRSRRVSLLLLAPWLAVSCAKKEPAYETAMRQWATEVCNCCLSPGPEAITCIDGLGGEPEFPDHFLDAMLDNPNHAVTQQYKDQTRQCCDRTP